MLQRVLAFVVLLSVSILGSVRGSGAEIATASDDQLKRWLQQYPQADTNGDGQLTVEEAEAYRRVLDRKRRPEAAGEGFEHEYTYVQVSDGVKIAIAVGYPRLFSRDKTRKWPTVFSLCGYTSATVPMDPGRFGHRCVTVNMSIRGTGASGGKLSPWRPRSWRDGYEVIEEWIVKQPWSNERVAIIGHSWPGLMGFLVATTNPPSLKAVCVSGLIEDFYRGIARIGGVRNCGFPVDWLNSYYSPAGPFDSGEAARLARGLDDAAYRGIVESRPKRDLREDFLWLLMHEPFDTPAIEQRSLRTYASQIRAPILVGQSYQDEQTGTSGWWLWKRVSEDVPKRLVLSNGNHGVTPALTGDLSAWLEHWLLEEGDGQVADVNRRVQIYFETSIKGPDRRYGFKPPIEAADFPLPNTQWTPYYLRSGKRLSTRPPDEAETRDAYRVAHGGQLSDASQWIDYVIEFTEPTAICGPIVLTLWAKMSSIDTDFFALIADLDPKGRLYGLQRGLLRASHREVDETHSEYVLAAGKRQLIRPWHPHQQARPVTPHVPHLYQIEIPTVGHVFRPGHRLVLRLTRPPEGDPIGVTRSEAPSYRYDSDPPPGMIEIMHDAQHSSNLLLPVLTQLPPEARNPTPLSAQAGLKTIP